MPEKKKKNTTKETVKKKETKQKTSHSQEESSSRKEVKIQQQKDQKAKGLMLMLIGFATLLFVGFFLFGKFFRPQSISELLPAQRTVGTLEVNIDGNNGQVQKFYELLADYSVYRQSAIIALINTALPLNYQTELEPWLGRQVGLALLTGTNSSSETFHPIIFIETRDQSLTLDFFKSRRLEAANEEVVALEHNGYSIYEFTISQRMSFTFMGSYVVIAESSEVLAKMLDDYQALPRLSDDPTYRKVANNLPQGGMVFAYINYKKLFNTLEEDELFVAKKGQDLLALRPFLNVFHAEGLSVFAENDRFVAQNFTSIDNKALDGEEYITFKESYQANLLQLVGKDTIFLAGGHNLSKELNRLEEIFKSGTKTPALMFEGLVEAQKQRYFGKKIGLKEDIYPLFAGEYLVAVEGSLEEPEVSIFLELNDDSVTSAHFDRIINEFIQVSGVFSPQVREVELPDGTTGKELVASQEKIERSSSVYAEQTVTTLKLGETGVSFQYVVLDNILALTTNANSLKKIIDRHEDEAIENLTTTTYYQENLRPLLHTADQVIHMKVGAFTELLGLSEDSMIAPYLVPLNNFTVTKNFFADGVSTTYLVEIL